MSSPGIFRCPPFDKPIAALIAVIVALGAVLGMGKVAASINAEFSKVAAQLT